MRIALLAPLVAPIAPPFLGGAQALVYDLGAGLAARGHAVTLYAADGSSIPGVHAVPLGIDAATLRPARFDPDAPEVPDPTFFTQAHHFLRIALHIAQHAGEYDLVHAHAYDWPAFTFPALLPLPILHTLHLPASSAAIVAALEALGAAPAAGVATGPAAPNTHLATVSHACAATYAPRVHIPTVVYNGIDVDAIPFGPTASTPPYLLFAGRMAPEKGVADALAIARRAGRRIVLTGGMYDAEYFEHAVLPRLAEMERAGLAEYLGQVPRERLWQLMAGAEAVLCPSHWQEPFGLVPAEAQAAGAPVIGYAHGALPEIVAQGETGWLVAPGDLEAAAAAVDRLSAISRAACRDRVAANFSLSAMLDAYERVYGAILAGNEPTA